MSRPEKPPLTETPTRAWPKAEALGQALVGRTLGDFRVEQKLGQGGMGEVYLARQISLGRPVALKVLRPDLTNEPTDLARFEAEAWSIARLNHPNIVQIYTLGHAEGLHFLAMEYVDGASLREILAEQRALELSPALAILEQAARALADAEKLGLVHRDIKPENLLLGRDGRLKVADFGLCRDPNTLGTPITRPDLTSGTPLYMSPEQIQGLPLDHRSDLYALGVTAFEMLAGEPPFQAETSLAIALKHLSEPPTRLDEYRPDLPPAVGELVMRLLAKAPADRYPSAAALLSDLEDLRALEPKAPETWARDSKRALSASTWTGPQDAPNALSEVPLDSLGRECPTREMGSKPSPDNRRAPRWIDSNSAKVSRLGRRRLAQNGSLLLIGMLAGAAWGWHERPDSLLSNGSDAPGVPGLWMESWAEVPAFPNAKAQYQYAQNEAPPASRLAAWLAVPGRFPGASARVYQAYVQIARHLFRHGMADRLDVLAEEIDAWPRSRSANQRPLWQALSQIAHAGSGAIRGDGMAVKGRFQAIKNPAHLDPAVAELGLEVLLLSQRPGNPASADEQLNRLRDELTGALGLSELGGLPVGGAWLLESD